MRKITVIVLWVIALLAVSNLFSACDETDAFTTDMSHVLRFSTDTVDFDTILSTISSSTRSFQVYNRNKNKLRIASVRLKKGANSPFKVNVDGVFLSSDANGQAFDFEVRGKDSIRVFVEVNVGLRHQDTPIRESDSLVFQLENGVEQHVFLTVAGQDAYMWHGKRIMQDTTLTAGKPFVIYDSLYVAPGATLTLQPGVNLYFHDKANLLVQGRLNARGTLLAPVVFRGDRTDRMFDYLPYDNMPSRWGGIRFYAESTENVLQFVDIHSATYGIVCDSADVHVMKFKMENSQVHNIGGNGLELNSCKVSVVNSQISNTFGDCVRILGGWSEFVHCTLAQFYPWDASRGQALSLANHQSDIEYPLLKAHFLNCIITGYADDVIKGKLEEGTDTQLDYYFANSLLNTIKSDDEARFVSIVYDNKEQKVYRDKNFKVFDVKNYLYDFTLDSVSPARNIGMLEWARLYPFDLKGVSRFLDDGPDAGCYEYFSK